MVPGFLDLPPCNPADNDGVSLLGQNIVTTTTKTQNCPTGQQNLDLEDDTRRRRPEHILGFCKILTTVYPI
jgi:hypothetical protein